VTNTEQVPDPNPENVPGPPPTDDTVADGTQLPLDNGLEIIEEGDAGVPDPEPFEED